jgi:phage terminase large subunit-like protein
MADQVFPVDVEEIRRQIQSWPAADRERALRELNARTSDEHQIWFCTLPNGKPNRQCNGKPHDGVPYSHARSDQWPPRGHDWMTWVIMGGRGSGKTRSGSEATRMFSRKVERIALIGATNSDVRNTMIEGESGLIRVFERAGEKVIYEPAKKRVLFANGAIATVFSGEEPDRLRGPQHGFGWLDEPAHYPLINDVWDQFMFGLRLGQHPHVIITTTPLPTKWMKARIADKDTVLSRVSTRANLDNLAPTFVKQVIERYEGTRLGRQELEGEILPDVEGALWNDTILARIESAPSELERIVVAIDPAGTANRRSDQTGIVAVGKLGRMNYVLDDKSSKYSPDGWARAAINLHEELRADAIIVEKNYGGDMVRTTIESTAKAMNISCPRIIVTTAMRSKQLRAEPVVAMYEQSRVFHLGRLSDLEEEMLTWVPGQGDSPNRVDALVWGLTELGGISSVATMASPNDFAVERTTRIDRGLPDALVGAGPGRHRLNDLPDSFPLRRTFR